jgi:hypothetical protein
MSGPFQGTAGWIDRIDGDLASLLEQPLKGGSGSNSSREMKAFFLLNNILYIH